MKNLIKPQTNQEIRKPLNQNILYFLVFFFTFILYGNTLKFGYVLDDDFFIKYHQTVQKGISGIKEIFTQGSTFGYSKVESQQPYRPVTLLSFALNKSFTKSNPVIEHFLNIFFYGLIGCSLFKVLNIWLKGQNTYLKLFCVFLFLVHPVHTEVVANVKSRDEIFALFFALLSIISIHNYVKYNDIKYLFFSALYFILSLLSKENGITLLAVLPLSLYFFENISVRKTGKILLPFAGIVSFYFLVRLTIMKGIGDGSENDILNNVLAGSITWQEKSATIMLLLGKYLELLFIPYPLSWDYSFNQIPVVNWKSLYAFLSLLIYLFLFVFAIVKFKSKSIFSFLILYFLITISVYSNIFFLNGATLAERFLFMPSVAFCVIIPLAFIRLLKIDYNTFFTYKKPAKFLLPAGILVIGIFLTINRNADWESNFKLFESGIYAAPNSSRTHSSFAYECNLLADKTSDNMIKSQLKHKAESEYVQSLAIYPQNTLALNNLANLYLEKNELQKAKGYFSKAIQLESNQLHAIVSLG